MNQARRYSAPSWMQRKERGSFFWLRLMCGLSHRFGRRCSRSILYAIALYFLLFAGAARRASRAYLVRCLPRAVSWKDQYRHLLSFATTIHDRVYLLRDQYSLFQITLSGAEELHRESASAGLLLLGAHLGSFEVLRSMARYRPGLEMSMAMYADNARQINRVLHAINPQAKQDIIALGTLDAMLTVHRRLKEGSVVGILADRAAGPDQYVTRHFLGAPAQFPTGPFRLAVMLNHPVYFMVGLYLGANRYQVHFERLETTTLDATTNREMAALKLLERYIEALERQCRAHPFNWFNFYDFWQQN